MKHLCAVGLQWGDEGKGKIVDVLSHAVDAVVRYQGGANAGHTVYIGDERRVLHHLPTGILRDGILAILGNGMVVEPAALLAELRSLPTSARQHVYLSDRAHVVLPHHRAREREREQAAKDPIGTTGRGIGPAYEDKYARVGVRLGDLLRDGYLDEVLRPMLERGGIEAAATAQATAAIRELLDLAGERIVDVMALLHDLDAKGKRLLFEGAQGSLLDIDFGTYPFVTSSSPSFLGLGSGSGFSPRRIDHVLGITKVYCTRVGGGPFPSEANPAEAERLRERGGEFGTTTGRPRRCGWLDLPALRYALRMNDVDSVALTKADVLDGRPRVPVVVDYRRRGRTEDCFPQNAEELAAIEPIYEEWPGWNAATPEGMRPFIDRLEAATERPVTIISWGRRRSEVELLEPFRSWVKGRR